MAVLVAVVKRLFLLVFVVLYNGRSIFLFRYTVEFGICLQINFAVTKDPVTHCFLKRGLNVSGLGRVIFTR